MPLRREGNRVEQIESFDSWVEETLNKAIERGEFDNLPLKGKPIRIDSNPFQPELDMAFHMMKNAGAAPAWIELDREVCTMQESLDHWLQAGAGRLAAEAARLQQPAQDQHAEVSEASSGSGRWYQRWWPFRLFAADRADGDDDNLEVGWRRWNYERLTLREQYLQRAAQLDSKIQMFNNSVPRELWNLEKMRLLPERAEQRFESAIPHLAPH